jgi:hypothetical protein
LIDDNIRKHDTIASGNGVILINEITEPVAVNGDAPVVDAVIDGIMKAFISHALESRISISSRRLHGDMIELNIKDDHCGDAYAIALQLQAIVPLAEQIGGQLDIMNRRQTITTVSFRFFPEKMRGVL